MGDIRGRRFVIWGGGGHGKVVADLIRSAGGTVAGYIDSDAAKLESIVEPGGARVVMLQEDFLAGIPVGPPSAAPDALALAVGRNDLRLDCLQRAGSIGAPPLVHPSATVSPSVRMGRATVVFAGAVVNAAAQLGQAVIVNSGAVVEHDCIVGDGAHVSPGAVIAGGVQLGELSWIGAGATVIPGLRVGVAAVVGAGAVVLRDLQDGEVVAGVPARPISHRPI